MGCLATLFSTLLAAYTIFLAFVLWSVASHGWENVGADDVRANPGQAAAILMLVGFPWVALAVPAFALTVARRRVRGTR